MTDNTQAQALQLIRDLVEVSDSVWTAETFGDEERVGFNFEAGEFSGEIYMSKATADKHWPNPEGEE